MDFTFTTAKKTTAADIQQAIMKYADIISDDIFTYTNDPVVSSDFNHCPCSAIVDLSLTKVVDETMGRVAAWYDNEWGFSHRMLDTAHKMLSLIARIID
jgi:glyceraldehyde 3-phosphate dehydrogenase